MGATRIIFCNDIRLDWKPIEYRLRSCDYPTEVKKVRSVISAVDALPKNGRCIVLTESVILGEEGVSQLPSLCKAKNPYSVVVLYTGETYDIDVSSFDYYVNSYGKFAFSVLFAIFDKYCR